MQDELNWLKADLSPPFVEHLSFRLGNQVFYLRPKDAEGRLQVPGSRRGLQSIAEGCQGHACLMPMQRRGTGWEPALPGWGLCDLHTGTAIDPVALVTAPLIPMTEWELHDFAVQIVRDHLAAEGRRIMSSQGNPGVDPSLWFVGDAGSEWVVVRAFRYPTTPLGRPADWDCIAAACARLSPHGHFAPVGFANADGPNEPLWRGHGLHVRFIGLE